MTVKISKAAMSSMPVVLLGAGLLALFGMATAAVASAAEVKRANFVLSSPDAQLAISVPDIYTAKAFGCAGGNLSPALRWTGVPRGTKSFVITLFDRDERSTPSGWWHWVLYDVPSDVDHLAVGAGAEHSAELPAQALQGRTDLGTSEYHGPCPAKGDPPHRYVFTVYAVNVATLPVVPGSSGAMVTSIVQEHLLGKAVFVAHYGR